MYMYVSPSYNMATQTNETSSDVGKYVKTD